MDVEDDNNSGGSRREWRPPASNGSPQGGCVLSEDGFCQDRPHASKRHSPLGRLPSSAAAPGNNSSISGQMCVGSRDAKALKQPLQQGANEVGAASPLSMGLPHHGKNGTGLPQIPSGLVPQAGEGCPPHDLPDFPVGEDSQNGGKGRRLPEHHPSEPERGESSLTEEGSSWGQGVPPCVRPRGELPVPTGAGVPSGQTLHLPVLSGSTILRSARQLDYLATLPSTGQPATRRHTACGGILQYNNNNPDTRYR